MDTAIPVLGLAVVDSINPSALAVALWWLTRPAAALRLFAYIAGIFLAYTTLGIALMLGLGAVIGRFGAAFDHPIALAVQLVIGMGLLGYGIFAPKATDSAPEPRQPRIGGLVGMLLLGATVTVIEMITALPYFAAIALMTSAKLQASQWLPLLLVYNVIFIAPPLLLLGLYLGLGGHLQGRFGRWHVTMQRGAREAMLWIVAIAGVALSGDAIGRYMDKQGHPSAKTVVAKAVSEALS